MTLNQIARLLNQNAPTGAVRYAIVDTAATYDDSAIFSRLCACDAPKAALLTGESAWASEHTAPYLVQLHDQPELEKWFLESGWGNGWGIWFTSRSDFKALLRHFQSLFVQRARNGRETYFRFYDPSILGDILPMLSVQERVAFLGPVDRFVFEGPDKAPVVFDKPAQTLSLPMDLSAIIQDPEKRKRLAEQWRHRLLARHVSDYRKHGFDVTPSPDVRMLTLEDKSGATARLQKTSEGVAAVTGENRRFEYRLTSCRHPETVVDPAGNGFHFDIQERNNRVKENLPPMLSAIRMEGAAKTWVFDYDKMHHLTGIAYPDGTSASVEHNSYGHQTGWVDRNGNAARSSYDFAERLSSFENANGRETRFDYDEFTAPSSIAFADGAAFGFEYTDAGALKKFLAGNRMVADYRIDPQSGSWKVDYRDGGHAEFVVQNDRIIKAVNTTGTVELDYDDNGRLIKETFQNRSVIYHRNETGQLTGITTPFGQTIRYELYGENRVSGIHAWPDHRIDIQYSPNGAMEHIDYPNGMRLEQNTDAMGLPERMRLSSGRGVLFDKSFRRDALNRVSRIKDRDQTVAFHYDKEGRLLKALSNRPEHSENFLIDANANRLADNHSRYDVNAADRITGAGRNEFHYDRLGNLIQGTCPKGNAKLTLPISTGWRPSPCPRAGPNTATTPSATATRRFASPTQ